MPEHWFQQESITSTDRHSLQPDDKRDYVVNERVKDPPKVGIKGLRHQERRRAEIRQNSRALRTAALERARLVLDGDLHDEEEQEVRIFLVDCRRDETSFRFSF